MPLLLRSFYNPTYSSPTNQIIQIKISIQVVIEAAQKKELRITVMIFRCTTNILTFAFYLSFTLINCSVSAAAETKLTLEDAIELSLKHNLDLQAAKKVIDQAKGRLVQSGRLPNPELEFTYSTDQTFNNHGEYDYSAGFKQKLPLSGRLSTAKRISELDLKIAEQEVLNYKRILIGEVVNLYRHLGLLQKKQSNTIRFKGELENLVSGSVKRYDKAEISEMDLNSQKLELEKLFVLESSLQSIITRNKIELNRLLGRKMEEVLNLETKILIDVSPSTLNELSKGAILQRPDRNIAFLQHKRASAEINLAKRERYEDLTVGVEFNAEKDGGIGSISDSRENFLGLNLSIPLPLWNQNQGTISEKVATEVRTNHELRSIEEKISSEIEISKMKLLTLIPILQRFENSSLKLARKNLQTLQRNYELGNASTLSVLNAQQQLLDIEAEYNNLMSEFATELTNFEVATSFYLRKLQ